MHDLDGSGENVNATYGIAQGPRFCIHIEELLDKREPLQGFLETEQPYGVRPETTGRSLEPCSDDDRVA